MATKPRLFNPNFYYHIYNCGVEKRDVFVTERDYFRFLETIAFYLHDQRISYSQYQDLKEDARQLYDLGNPKGSETLRVKLLSYCLMPNHFHLLLKPVKEGGITQFISDISNSHTRYFNIKNERIGGLFQGTFKSKEISSDESLFQVSRYIHLNPLMSSKTNPWGALKHPEDYPFSSYAEWTNPKGSSLVCQEEVSEWVKLVGGRAGYKEFVRSKIDADSRLGIEDLVLE